MIKVEIKNLQGIQTHGAVFETEQEAQSWINSVESKPSKPWGTPSQIIQQQVETQPAVLDENGLEISPAQYEMQEIQMPGSYTVEIIDISAQVEQQQANQNARQFLAESDWKVLRHRDQQDLGIATSMTAQEFADLLQQRQMAREFIS